MPISGSQNYSETGTQVVQDSLALIGEYTESQMPSAYQMNQAFRVLNRMLKTLASTPGLNLWLRKKLTLILEIGKQNYLAGPSGNYLFSGNYIDVTLTNAGALGATTIELTSTGMAVGDTIGILQNDDTYHWTTIATIPGATSVTITVGLASAAAAGNRVIVHDGPSSRPLKILHANFVDTQGFEIPARVISLIEYREMSNKDSEGAVLQVAYDPQLDNGVIHVWQVAQENEVALDLLVAKTIDDIDAGTDAFEIPQEFLELIHYGLAARLADIYQLPVNLRGYLWRMFKNMRDELIISDTENTSIYFQVDNNG